MIESFLGLFVLGSIAWWIASIIFLFVLFRAADKDSGVGMGLCLFAYFVFLQLLGKVDIITYIKIHPILICIGFISYLLLGTLWSFIKWWIYNNERAERIKEARCKFLNENKGKYDCLPSHAKIDKSTSVPGVLKEKWNKVYKNEKPIFSKNISKISRWIAYWPISLIWFLINDFVKKITKRIILFLQKIYQKITDRAFKDLEGDVKEQIYDEQ